MTFDPLSTARLTIRAFALDDAADLVSLRNDPRVAEYQDWTVPVREERARAMVESLVEMEGPTVDEWWMAAVCMSDTGDFVGDLAVHLESGGKVAEVGYNLKPSLWGRGLATEALASFVEYLFEGIGVERVYGMLHPDNRASASLLERTGFLFEGHTRLSFWEGEDGSDDWIYGMTRADWHAWSSRVLSPPGTVELVRIVSDTMSDFYRLRTHKTQESFVAPMPRSFANALFPEDDDGVPVVPWMRGVVADGVPVGFVMVALAPEPGHAPFLWRLLIDRVHQRRGIGRHVLDLLVAEFKGRGEERMLVSWHEGRGSPGPFYTAYGFRKTGVMHGDEVEAALSLD